MSQINKKRTLVVVAVACLLVAGIVAAQKLPGLNGLDVASAEQLSSAFRAVSHDVLPGIVSIETRGRAVRVGRGQVPLDENHPFRRFFEDDPRFRQFMEREQQFELPRGMGSGFVIDEAGVIMTNAHVVRDAEEVTVRLHDGREFTATDWSADPDSDIAILRIANAENLTALKLGNSDQMQIGDWVLAFGAPFGLDMSVTAGIISGKGRGLSQIRQELLQTDAAINPGNSGGPLVNIRGEVIGINTAISTRSGGYDGVGFAIPMNKAKWIGEQLVANGRVKRAFLGVRIQPVSNELAQQFGVPPGRGAIVTNIIPDSPAADSDLLPGDVILKMDGKNVNSTRSLQAIVEQLQVGEEYSMEIIRAGKSMTIKVTVRELPERFMAEEGPQESERPGEADDPEVAEFADLGLEVQDISAELREKLRLGPDASGVIVSSVEAGSPADRAGIGSRDVIEKVGVTAIGSVQEYRQALEKESLEEGILMLVNSRGSRMFVVVKQR